LRVINKSLSPSNDLVSVSGTLTNAGAGVLTITNLGPDLVSGDSFQLFTKPLSNGKVLTLNPFRPGPGLAWVNSLDVDGTLAVVAMGRPSLSASLGDNGLILTWPSNWLGCTLQMQTNPIGLGLGTNWVNVSSSISVNCLTNSLDPTWGSVFYRLIY
jgi:hypothetical protein